jgi:hypothetical protein
MSASSGHKLTDGADIAEQLRVLQNFIPMYASSVSLFPDDTDSAKTYLAVTQTLLTNIPMKNPSDLALN